MTDLEPLENSNLCYWRLSDGHFVEQDFSSHEKTLDNEMSCLETALGAEHLGCFFMQPLFSFSI